MDVSSLTCSFCVISIHFACVCVCVYATSTWKRIPQSYKFFSHSFSMSFAMPILHRKDERSLNDCGIFHNCLNEKFGISNRLNIANPNGWMKIIIVAVNRNTYGKIRYLWSRECRNRRKKICILHHITNNTNTCLRYKSERWFGNEWCRHFLLAYLMIE